MAVLSAVVGLVGAAAAVAGGPTGYLPAVGPPDLRLQGPTPVPKPRPLPPLPMSDPIPGAEAGASVRIPANADLALLPPAPLGSPGPDTPTDSALLPAAEVGGGVDAGPGALVPLSAEPRDADGVVPAVKSPVEPVVTPQMLLRFFRPVGSNYIDGAWTVPVFVPPSPPTPVSSASYRTP